MPVSKSTVLHKTVHLIPVQLIIVTGLPSSGKTYRAQQILADFESRISANLATVSSHIPARLTVQYLASRHASLDPRTFSSENAKPATPARNPRDLIYNSAREEKTARAEEFSAAKRALSKSNVVISDAPNYIKGFRYQMWCEAKAAGTRSIVVHVAAREDECKSWNEDRIRSWAWDEMLSSEVGTEDMFKGAKVGRDVRGELQPESHTAIYGDRLISESTESGTRSRTSSLDGVSDEAADTKGRLLDTMTLKSLYISDKQSNPHADTNGTVNRHPSPSGSMQSPASTMQAFTTTAASNPPLPIESLPYAPTTLQSLSMRYEPPSPFTRWDTPLFTIPSSDAHPPYQAIWDALFPPPVKPTKKVISQLRAGAIAETQTEEVRRHAATILPKASGSEALQVLESTTADVAKILLATAREQSIAGGEGGSLTFFVPDPKGGTDLQVDVEVPLNTMLSQPALQRLRRKYTQIQRGGIAHGQGYVSGRAEIVRDFTQFLETEWSAE